MELYRAKEISWLAFNERVMQEAENPDVPLIERFKFLGIYSNNLDEFYRVRVATLKRLTELGVKVKKIIGDEPSELLKKVNGIVLDQRKRYEVLQKSLIKELESHNVFMLNELNLPVRQRNFALDYFYKSVRPLLMPIMIDQVEKFPELEDEAIYFATILTKKDKEKERYSLIKLPTNELPRFLILPRKGEKKFIIFLDDVIRLGLKDLFSVYEFDSTEAYTIKLTKDAELDIDDDLGESYVQKISKGLKKREIGDPVRLVYDSGIPEHLLTLLKEKIGITKDDTTIAGGKYHNLKDLMQMPNLGGNELVYRDLPQVIHPALKRGESVFTAISKQDILLHFPYHSFENLTELLREASIDPKVKSIQISLYRLADKSNVVNALVNALRNGKSVTTVVELTARFNEKSNIRYSRRLHDEGARVIYGVQGLKVHAKMCQIARSESRKIVYYTVVGTGNFNEDTARVFSDVFILTKNQTIGSDVASVFNFINKNYQIPKCSLLVPSPFSLRDMIRQRISTEIENKRQGKPAYIHLKLNNLVDQEIIKLLYEASVAGVEVRLNVRGMFAPVLKGNRPETDNIEAMAIIDRYLEHARMFFFCDDGKEVCYISSADLMSRNLDRRVEVTCPVISPEIHNKLRNIFDLQWKDNIKARILDEDLKNLYRTDPNGELRSQTEIHNIYADS